MNKTLLVMMLAVGCQCIGADREDFSTVGVFGNGCIIREGAQILIEDGIAIAIRNQTIIQNEGLISCPKNKGESAMFKVFDGDNATIININHRLDVDSNFTDYGDIDYVETYYRPIGGGAITGNHEEIGVTIKDELVDLYDKLSAMSSKDVAVLAVDCEYDSGKVMTLTRPEEEIDPVVITAHIANDPNKEDLTPHSLIIREGEFELQGDQSHFNQDETKVTIANAIVKCSGKKSMPLVPIYVTEESTLKLTQKTEIPITKDLTVEGKTQTKDRSIVFSESGTDLILKAGVKFTLLPDED